MSERESLFQSRDRDAIEALCNRREVEPWARILRDGTLRVTGRARRSVLRQPPLNNPTLNVSSTPDAALGELRDGLGKARSSCELIGSLPADAEHLADLRRADEFHRPAVLHLTQSSVKRYSPLDGVKWRDGEMSWVPAQKFGYEPDPPRQTVRHLKRLAPGMYESPDGRYEVAYELYWLEGECECAVCQGYIFADCPNDGCAKREGWHIWDRQANDGRGDYASFAHEPQAFGTFREARARLIYAYESGEA